MANSNNIKKPTNSDFNKSEKDLLKEIERWNEEYSKTVPFQDEKKPEQKAEFITGVSDSSKLRFQQV